MNQDHSPKYSRWENLLSRARADAGPEADLPALLRAVRTAETAPEPDWQQQFIARFASARVIGGCVAAAGAFAVVFSWRAWEVWQALPWAQLVDGANGGGS